MTTPKSTLDKFNKLNTAIAKKMNASEKVGFDVFKKFAGITEYIGTGNYIVNAIISGSLFGGVPNTRSIEIAGPSGTGKTFFCMNILREMQRMGYYPYYIDTEGATEESDFTKFGCDVTKMQIIRTVRSYANLKFFMNTLLEAKISGEYDDMKIVVFVDSYGMLNTEKELEDARKGKNAADMGLRAKEGRQLFRTITLDLSNQSIPFIFTNHTGASLDLFAPGDIPSGGGGPTFAASIILLMDKLPLRETVGETKTQTGVILRVKTYKNRLAMPHEKRVHLSWRNGMNKYFGCEEYIGWDNCGVVRGTIMTEAEFAKKYKKGIAVNSTGRELVTHWFERDMPDPEKPKSTVRVKYAAVESDSAKTWAVRDTCQNVPLDRLWTSDVFTENTLKQMDETIIKPMFRYSTIEEQMQAEMDFFSSLAVSEAKTDAETNDQISIVENED